MEFHDFLTHLEGDATRLADVAAKGGEQLVPACPDWTVDDALEHLAEVYLHVVEVVRLGRFPEEWPSDFDGQDSRKVFTDACRTLLAELKDRGPRAPTETWWPADQTVGFWFRRMAQETAIHRVDVEAAYDVVTPVDPALATDGIDEALMLFLAGDWADHPVEEGDGKVLDILAGGRIWRITLEVLEVVCLEQAPGRALPDIADTSISGDASDMLLWLWGRGGLGGLTVTGDHELAEALRRRMELATQ